MTPLADAIAGALGVAVAGLTRLAGGDINDAFAVRLADGRRVFVKSRADADPRLFPCEARGLAWLAAAAALRVPAVLATDRGTAPHFLVLEAIASAPRAPDFAARLGRGLAQLHRAGAPDYGFGEANFIGSLPQDNTPAAAWPDFYARRRLEPLVRRAVDTGRARPDWPRQLARLVARLPGLAGPPEPPARLHGDLWSGNVLADERGHPVLIDPAVYGGHREMDLAMLRLFGDPSPAFFAAYDEVWPLAPGHADRVALWQLYPLLVHVTLFGGHYVSAADAALGAYR